MSSCGDPQSTVRHYGMLSRLLSEGEKRSPNLSPGSSEAGRPKSLTPSMPWRATQVCSKPCVPSWRLRQTAHEETQDILVEYYTTIFSAMTTPTAVVPDLRIGSLERRTWQAMCDDQVSQTLSRCLEQLPVASDSVFERCLLDSIESLKTHRCASRVLVAWISLRDAARRRRISEALCRRAHALCRHPAGVEILLALLAKGTDVERDWLWAMLRPHVVALAAHPPSRPLVLKLAEVASPGQYHDFVFQFFRPDRAPEEVELLRHMVGSPMDSDFLLHCLTLRA